MDIYTYVYTYTCMFMSWCTICVCVCVHVCICAHEYVCVCIRICICICILILICILICICMYTYICICIFTYMSNPFPPKSKPRNIVGLAGTLLFCALDFLYGDRESANKQLGLSPGVSQLLSRPQRHNRKAVLGIYGAEIILVHYY